MDDWIERLFGWRVLPVVTVNGTERACAIGEQLVASQLPVMEITLRKPRALACLRAARDVDQLIVGAGTVLHRDQAAAAVDAGAEFIVAPGLDESTVEYCQDRQVPIFPGVATASELQRAFNLGLRIVKFFPAEALGGAPTLRALGAAFGDLRFIPTGGIRRENLAQYLALPQVVACGGSWLVPGDSGDLNRIAEEVLAIQSIQRSEA